MTFLAPLSAWGNGPLGMMSALENIVLVVLLLMACLLYTSDAADERSSVDLGGRRIIKKKIYNYKSR